MIDTATALLAELLRLKEGLAAMLEYEHVLVEGRGARRWLNDRISRVDVLQLRAERELGIKYAPSVTGDPL